MACEICGQLGVFIIGAFNVRGIDPKGPNVDLCGNCFLSPSRDSDIQKSRNPLTLVPAPSNIPSPACCSCATTTSTFGWGTYLSLTDGFNYDICGMCEWLSRSNIETNLQTNINKGIIKSRAPNQKPSYLSWTWVATDNYATKNIKFADKTIAVNGLEGMYCKTCNEFNSWVEPNSGSSYICPKCR